MQLADGVINGDDVTGIDRAGLRPARRPGQPRVAGHGDVRRGPLHQRQRKPTEPSGVSQVGIASRAAEQVRRFGADGVDAIDGQGTHERPP